MPAIPSYPNLLPEDRERLKSFAEVIQNPEQRAPTDREKLAALAGTDAVILGRGGGWLSRPMIDAAERLAVVGVIGGSLRRLDAAYILDRGIRILNTGWAMSNAVAEFSVAMMLCGLRDIPYMVDVLRRDWWGRARNPLDLTGKPVGLVGFGMVGRRVAELLQPFRCDMRVYDPHVTDEAVTAGGGARTDLRDLLRRSFVVSLHAGLTAETRGLLGAGELALIPNEGLLVNTARAAVVEEAALIAELASGRIRAALNVFWKEPLPQDHPLRKLDNVILTPHGGGLTLDTQRRHSRSIVDDLDRFFRGEQPRSVVTREMLARMT